MTQGMAKRQCKAKLLYPHINWGTGGWQGGGCLETFTGRKTTLFCPKCCTQIYRLRVIGDMGIQHDENLYNLSESAHRQLTLKEKRKRKDASEIPIKPFKRRHNAKTLQQVLADRLPEAINALLDRMWQ